jgi:hypothetical protein
MVLISSGYGTAINSLLTDKPHSMDIPDWTLEMATKYFAMKQASKPRDYNSNRQDVYSKQPDQQPDKPDRQPEKQQDRQHDRQQTKPKCPDCGRSHPGACHKNTNMSNSSNPTSKPPNPSSNTNTQPTKETELAMSDVAGKSFFAKGAVESSQHTWHIDSGATYTTTPNKAWFVSYEARKDEYIQTGSKQLQKVKGIGTVELPNGLRMENVRHTPSIKVNLIALAELRRYKPRYQWETEEFLLRIDHTKTIRVPINDRLWPMHFKAMPTHKPRTPKQNSTATTTTTTKKAKGRALSLERRRQRPNPSQTKLANSPTPGLDTDQPTFKPTTRSMTRKSTSQEAVGASKSTNTVNLAIVMPEHDTEVEYENWTTEVIPPARAFYATTSTTGLNNDQPSYDRAMKDPKAT